MLTGFADHAEEVDEVEDLLADGVRLATKIGDTAAARTLAERAVALADDTEIPHRQANALLLPGPGRPRRRPAAPGRGPLPRRRPAAAPRESTGGRGRSLRG